MPILFAQILLTLTSIQRTLDKLCCCLCLFPFFLIGNAATSSHFFFEFAFLVVEHIWLYEPQPSHYTRHKAPDKRYLDPKLTLSKIYKDFLNLKGYVTGTASKPPLSIASSRKIFFSYNLSFRKPRKDTCGRCDSLQVAIEHSTDMQEVSETKLL